MMVAVLTGMVGAAECLGEKEIIFPEVAALCVGVFLAPKMAWKCSRSMMIVSITACAILGTCISQFLPWPLWSKLILSYLIAQLALIASRTTLAPMISASVLPVMMGTTGYAYPLSAFVLAAACAVLPGNKFDPSLATKNAWGTWRDYGLRSIVVSAWIGAAYCIGFVPLAAPPLLVAYTQLSRPDHPMRKRLMPALCMIAFCALVGVFVRYALVITLGLPITLAAAVASTVVAMTMIRTSLFFPPAAAMAILPLLF